MSNDNFPVRHSNQINLNTFMSVIVLGCMAWIGFILKDGSEKLIVVSQRLAVIEALKQTETAQRDRIEVKLDGQQRDINALMLDMARLKGPEKP